MNFIPEIDQHATQEELTFFTDNLLRSTGVATGIDSIETTYKEIGITTLEGVDRHMGLYTFTDYYDGFLNEIFDIQMVKINPLSEEPHHTNFAPYLHAIDDSEKLAYTGDECEFFIKQEHQFIFRREVGHEYPYDFFEQDETTVPIVHAKRYLDVSICDEDEIEVFFVNNDRESKIEMEEYGIDLCAPTRRDLLRLNYEMIAVGLLALEVTAYDTAPKYIPAEAFFK